MTVIKTLEIVSLTCLGMTVALGTFSSAQTTGPSFNCGEASRLDERAICANTRLAELDQATSIAFAEASQEFKDEAQKIAVESLAARHACGANPLCILDQQVRAIGQYAHLKSTVAVPSWVSAYAHEILNAPELGGTELPISVGQYAITEITEISTRFGGELKRPENEPDSSGSAVTYANKGYQVSYDFIQALADSRVGDTVLLRLASVPRNCPPGDNRGRIYSATNLRTGGSWLLPDAQHSCGGA